MKRAPLGWWTPLLALLILLTIAPGLNAQQDKVAALKQALAANQQLQRQYKWVETTVVSMKGEEKSRIQKQCFYSPDGKVQKQQLSAPPEQSSPGGVKGKVVAKKKAEITATMNQAASVVQSYVPPDPQRIQAAKAAGNLALSPTGPDSTRLDLRNYVKSGDTLSLGLDTARNAIQTISVKSYLESQSDAVDVGRDVRPAPRRALLPGQHRAQRAEGADPGGDPELQLRAGHAGGTGDGAEGDGAPRPRPLACRRRPSTT